jgi:hypothetical protein
MLQPFPSAKRMAASVVLILFGLIVCIAPNSSEPSGKHAPISSMIPMPSWPKLRKGVQGGHVVFGDVKSVQQMVGFDDCISGRGEGRFEAVFKLHFADSFVARAFMVL